jgi:hypothetical protein
LIKSWHSCSSTFASISEAAFAHAIMRAPEKPTPFNHPDWGWLASANHEFHRIFIREKFRLRVRLKGCRR